MADVGRTADGQIGYLVDGDLGDGGRESGGGFSRILRRWYVELCLGQWVAQQRVCLGREHTVSYVQVLAAGQRHAVPLFQLKRALSLSL